MRVGLTGRLEPEAKTGNSNLATSTNCEKAVCHRGGAALQKRQLLALATQGLEAKKITNQRNASRRSPDKRQTQRCTTLEKLNAV